MRRLHCDKCDASIVLPAGQYFALVRDVPLKARHYISATLTMAVTFTVDSSVVDLCEACAKACFDAAEPIKKPVGGILTGMVAERVISPT
jgi:hypothetical protein